jgi:hypothetical protein
MDEYEGFEGTDPNFTAGREYDVISFGLNDVSFALLDDSGVPHSFCYLPEDDGFFYLNHFDYVLEV